MSFEPIVIHSEVMRLRVEVQAETTRQRTVGRRDQVDPRKSALMALHDALATASSCAQVLYDMDIAAQDLTR